MKTSTKDRIKGSFNEVRGTIKEGVGKFTDDRHLQAQGKAEQKEAKLQQRMGEAKENVAKLQGQLKEVNKAEAPKKTANLRSRIFKAITVIF